MIPRYSLPEMSALFTDVARMSGWLEVELAAVDGWAALGVVPDVCSRGRARARAPQVDEQFVSAVNAREAITDHDLAAFVDVVQDCDRTSRRLVGPLRAHLVRCRRHRSLLPLSSAQRISSSTRRAV